MTEFEEHVTWIREMLDSSRAELLVLIDQMVEDYGHGMDVEIRKAKDQAITVEYELVEMAQTDEDIAVAHRLRQEVTALVEVQEQVVWRINHRGIRAANSYLDEAFKKYDLTAGTTEKEN